MKPRREHWRAFGPEWFAAHQCVLLWLLNVAVIGRWFRWCLCIDSPREILEIRPHHYTVFGEQSGTLTTDFRTHHKYAKRLYYAFRPLWWAMHAWDVVADAWWPQLSFGLATLTAYPDPDVEVTSVDGHVSHVVAETSWGTIQAGAGTAADDAFSAVIATQFTAGSTSNQWINLYRGAVLFDTSAIGNQSTVTSAVLSLFGSTKSDDVGATPNLNVYQVSPSSNTSLAASDYATFGTTELSTSITYAGWSTSAYNEFALNGSGLVLVSLTGISKFGLRNANYDVANSAPPWPFADAQSYLRCHSADAGGTSNDPRLEVTYTLPSKIVAPNRLRPAIFAPGIAR